MITTELVLRAGGQGVIYKHELVQKLHDAISQFDRRLMTSLQSS